MIIDIKAVSNELGYALISGIINSRGRPVRFNVSLGLQLCPECAGENPFCPVCEGNQNVHVEESVEITALIRWAGEGQRKYEPVGQYVEGDCTIVTAYTERSLDPYDCGIMFSGSEYLVKHARSVTVDDRKLVISKYMRAGTPINRVYFICVEDDDIGT